MTSQRPESSVFVCDACDNVAVGTEPPRCCGSQMSDESTDAPPVNSPELDRLLKHVFDMSSTELDVCLCVMEAEESTVADVASDLDVDRSLVSRHLNHLADLGVVEKSRRIRQEGGHVHVYRPVGEETVKRRLKTELYRWLDEAVTVVDDLSREKVEAIATVTDRSTERHVFE